MSDTPNPDDKPTIDLSVDIGATPEQVWQAISTGPGISAWFVPASVDDHVGGKLHLSFDDMGEETAVLTTLDAPNRLVTAERERPRWRAWMAEHFAHPEPQG